MANATDDRLRLIVEKYERLEDERKGISDDMKDVLLEAKSAGYDVKALRRVFKIRKMKPDDRAESEAILILMCNALGIETQGSLF